MARKATSRSLRPSEIVRLLSKSDQKLAAVIATVGELEVRPKRDGFEAVARAIVGQQLSAKAAKTIFARVALVCGNGSLSAESYLGSDRDAVRKAGVSGRKEAFLRGLALAVVEGVIDFDNLEDADDEFVVEKLCRIKGIGRWTAEMHLIFGMHRLDVFPLGDVALQRVMCRLYRWHESDFAKRGPKVANRWKPFRSVACRYLYAFGDLKPALE